LPDSYVAKWRTQPRSGARREERTASNAELEQARERIAQLEAELLECKSERSKLLDALIATRQG
jgi:hypothetical protein